MNAPSRAKGTVVVMLMSGVLACGGPARAPETPEAGKADPAAAEPRRYLLERIDDAAVGQLYADGFTQLPLNEKTLVWHLYQAAIAGRDIFYDQKHPQNLDMRDVLEAIVQHPAGVDAVTLAEVQRYTKLFWLNTGPYNNLTARKFVLKCTPAAFGAAVRLAAARRRAPSRSRRERPLDQLLAASRADVLRRVGRSRWSPPRRRRPARTSSPPAPTTCTSGVTMKDVEGFSERYPLNSRLVKQNGTLVEEVYRDGRPLRHADRRDRQAPRSGDPVSPRQRWPTRSGRS